MGIRREVEGEGVVVWEAMFLELHEVDCWSLEWAKRERRVGGIEEDR